MKPAPFEYAAPRSIGEALALLRTQDGEAKILAGGQSLMPLLAMRLARPSLLVDLGHIEGLDYVREESGVIAIGAMTTKSTVERSDLVRTRQPLFHEATRLIAHPQIRNRGTVGGSMAQADPAAEYPAAALALDAKMRIVGEGGERIVDAADFFVSTLTTALEPGEILIEVRVPMLAPGTGWSLLEVSRRHGDFAMAGVAATRRARRRPRALRPDRALRCRPGRRARTRGRGRRRGEAADGVDLGERSGARPRRGGRAAVGPARVGRVSTPSRGCVGGTRAGRGRVARGNERLTSAPEEKPVAASLRIRVTVNGAPYEAVVDPRLTLADFLRADLGLGGTHVGCEHGVCGACTILLDGRTVRSCLMLAVQADGREPHDHRGARPRRRAAPDPAGVRRGARPAVRLLHAGLRDVGARAPRTHPDPSDEEIRDFLGGNLCRCTGYQAILRSVKLAARRLREPKAQAEQA